MNSLKTTIFLFILLSFSSTQKLYSQVVINEYSCSNLTQFADNYGDYGDWFELYNTSASNMSIGGYYLSDDSLNNLKWMIPPTVNIPANGFLRFWASGRNIAVGTSYHTNFKLTQTKNSAEVLVLTDPGGTIVDYKKINHKTQLGHSYGRTLNGAAFWSYFTTPTPNSSNNTSNPYDDYADRPDYSAVAGFYPAATTVAITTTELNADIHYTLDGTIPTVSSPIYTTPLTISSTSVLKAITMSADPLILPSFMEYATFFINVSHTMPVVSIAGTQLNTLANGSGSLEPKGSFELFDVNQQRVAHTYGEFNRHGQDSWVNSQRSLDFISRDEMGYNHSVEDKIFSSSTRENFQRLVLRAAGDDNYPADHHSANAGSAHIRDAYVHNLAIEGGMDLDVRRAEKCVVYLNGNYWGVYDIRENPDDHDFTNYYYGQDKFNIQYIETWGNTWAQYGGQASINDWNTLYNFAMNNNLNFPSNYQYVTDRLDVNSLADYVIANAFSVCSDWLNYNTGWWRGLDSTGTHLKWGYILWDNDATFGHYINYTGIPDTTAMAEPCDPEGLTGGSDPEGHIALLNKLRTNPTFNQYYIGRQIDLWNTVFSCDNMLTKLDSIIAVLDPEMTMHALRWNGTYSEWYANAQYLRTFIQTRCTNLSGGFISCYNLTGPYQLTLNTDPIGAGTVQLNSLTLNQFPWTGTYFGGMTTKLKVNPNANYSFTNWSSTSQVFTPGNTALNVDFTLGANDSIIAHFLTTTSVVEVDGKTPNLNVYPTLFSDEATIDFNLPEAATVSINLYSLTGAQVIQLQAPETKLQAGKYGMKINLAGTTIPAGIYLLNFRAGSFSRSIKLIYTAQ